MRQDGELDAAARVIGNPGRDPGGDPGGKSSPAVGADNPEPAIDNRLFVLVLQHPQERTEKRATAAVLVAALRRARLVVGLSWPNLTRALGRPESRPADPRRWGVLYLGSALPLSKPQDPVPANGFPNAGTIIALSRDGNPLSDADRVLRGLEGIVLLDGTWSQAKTLWWRNPWLLKLQRLVLNPPDPARFGRLRREPRPEALSTLEAAALVLRHVEPSPEPAEALIAVLDRLIAACGGQGGGPGGGPGDGVSARGADGPRDYRNRHSPNPYARRQARYRGRSAAG